MLHKYTKCLYADSLIMASKNTDVQPAPVKIKIKIKLNVTEICDLSQYWGEGVKGLVGGFRV